jgi:acetyltransferase-like isoleucine patch superfamily enzyme
VVIGVAAHPTNFVSTHPSFYSNPLIFETFAEEMHFKQNLEIKIGNDVWIGSHSKIIGNLTIGDGAIIALGAVVTKDVPPYAIVGGIPARIIKFRFNDEIINFLVNTKWWDLDVNWIKENYKKFHNIDDFVELIHKTTNV